MRSSWLQQVQTCSSVLVPLSKWIWCFCWVGSFSSKCFTMGSCESTLQTLPGTFPNLSPQPFHLHCSEVLLEETAWPQRWGLRVLCFSNTLCCSAGRVIKKNPTFFPSSDCGGVTYAGAALMKPCLPVRCWDWRLRIAGENHGTWEIAWTTWLLLLVRLLSEGPVFKA